MEAPQCRPQRNQAAAEDRCEAERWLAAGQQVLRVVVREGGRHPRPAPGLGPAHLLAGGADEAARVQPVIILRPQSDLQLLAGVEAGVCVVEDDDLQAAVLAVVVVAAGAPVLPLPDLGAAPLLPHLLRVVEASAARPVTLQREVSIDA